MTEADEEIRPLLHSSTAFTPKQLAEVLDRTDRHGELPWGMVVTNEPRRVIVTRKMLQEYSGGDYHIVLGFDHTVELAVRILKLLAPGYRIILDDPQNDPAIKERFLAIIETREVLQALGSLER